MALEAVLLSLLLFCAPLTAFAQQGVAMGKDVLTKRFLLQTSYQQKGGWQNFMTSRSRIVIFRRHGAVLRMIEVPRDSVSSAHLLAAIPIRRETANGFVLDFNAGLDKIFHEEDRTGEDYYGRAERRDYSFFRLLHRKMLSVMHDGCVLVLEQAAVNEDEDQDEVLVHYYLSPYVPDPSFKPFEMKSLVHFGFYETYPRHTAGRTVLYATKFDAHRPIVFALSSNIPSRFRDAVRDGVLYWNKALGKALIHVEDAPPGVGVPNPDYNVIQWITAGNYGSTSHIQEDPLTGEILHAYIFIRGQSVASEGSPSEQQDRLRYIVAHEVGHALGLRHNFAKGPISTVMNYFDFDQSMRVGREIESSSRGLVYDRDVVRYVYLGEPLDVQMLPAFCTDNQPGCSPYKRGIMLGARPAIHARAEVKPDKRVVG